MTRLLLGAGLLVWAGAALLLSTWPRLARPSLEERLRPFHPGAASAPRRPPLGSFSSLGQVLLPLVRDAGDRLAAALGVSEGAERRLRRIHSATPAGLFRLRQAGLAALALIAGGLVAVAVSPPPLVALFMVLGAPALAFLVMEHGLAQRSQEWQRAIEQEVPVVAEQLAMLLNAGYSVGTALSRLADRGRGCVARDLQVVLNRMHQGLSEGAALREWSELSGVDCVHRLVSVLVLHSEAADLGRLVSTEVRAARRELQRTTVEQIEKRSQQVWVPVTVATLVPGAILLAVPFLAALHLFANA